MANFSYPTSSIIGGVSNLEYAIRMDSQATDQENCLLSPKYGLAKRPNSRFLCEIKNWQNIGSTAQRLQSAMVTNSYGPPYTGTIIHPLVYGDDERLLVIMGTGAHGPDISTDFEDKLTENYVIVDPNTPATSESHKLAANVVVAYPSSGNAALSCADNLGIIDPDRFSLATVGDYTFISYEDLEPRMKTTTWTGYNETYSSTSAGGDQGFRTILNDEVFAIWFKAHQTGKQEYNVTIDIEGESDEFTFNISTKSTDSGANGDYEDKIEIKNDTKYLAAIMSYHISGQAKLEATSLSPHEFATGNIDSPGTGGMGEIANQAGEGGTSVITGRIFDDMDPLDNNGANYTPSQVSSVKAEGARGQTNVRTCFKSVESLSDLPPRSWEDHTVEIQDTDEAADTFFMRFISDEATTREFTQTGDHNSATNKAFGTHTSFGSDNYAVNSKTTKLPRYGHWEEYCGVGVEQTIDSATMPLVLVRRTDGTFVLMEARGSFQINTATPSCVFTAGSNSITITLDGGFSEDGLDGSPTSTDAMALIVGDTIRFTTGSSNLFNELEKDKDYYIRSVTKNTARAYTVTLSETDGGSTLLFTGGSTGDEAVELTTYSNVTWAKREAGDDTTNPAPDFLYRKINQLFTYQNRLGFVSDKEVWFSSAGDPFNLFRTTVRDVLDDDPFGLSPSDSRGDVIKGAAPFGQNLVIFTNEAQHIVRSLDGRFSSKTVEIVPASHATCDFDPRPVAVKDSLFFTYSTSEYGGVWEFRPSSIRNNTFESTDISAHIPGYLPPGARKMAGSSKHGMVFYLDAPKESDYADQEHRDDPTDANWGLNQNLYCFTFNEQGGERVQSAWTKWRFNADFEFGPLTTDFTTGPLGYQILNMAVMGDRLYLITATYDIHTDGNYYPNIYLEAIDLDLSTEDDGINDTLKANFDNCLLDRKTTKTQIVNAGTENSYTGQEFTGGNTKIILPWNFHTTMKDSIEVVTSGGVRYSSTTSPKLSVTASTASERGYLTVAGVDITGLDYFVGFSYTMSSTVGPFAPRIQNTPMRGRQTFVRGARLTYTKANEFNIAVTHGGTTYNDTVSAGTNTGTKSGEMYFGIRQHMPDLSFTISNSAPWNAMFQGLMYDLNIQEVMGRG